MKPNLVPNCIRSENYMITFEVDEEKYSKTSITIHFMLNIINQTPEIIFITWQITGFLFLGKSTSLSLQMMPLLKHIAWYISQA